MVDTYVSGAYGEICVGSSPISDTIIRLLTESYFNACRLYWDAEPHKAKPGTGSSGSELRLECFCLM